MSVIKLSEVDPIFLNELYREHARKRCVGTIEFFLNGKSLGEIELPEMTTPRQRMVLAKILGLNEFDDFALKHPSISSKASEYKLEDGITVAKKESDGYKKYLQQK